MEADVFVGVSVVRCACDMRAAFKWTEISPLPLVDALHARIMFEHHSLRNESAALQPGVRVHQKTSSETSGEMRRSQTPIHAPLRHLCCMACRLIAMTAVFGNHRLDLGTVLCSEWILQATTTLEYETALCPATRYDRRLQIDSSRPILLAAASV